MKGLNLFYLKLPTYLIYCPLFNAVDLSVFIMVMNSRQKGTGLGDLVKLSGLEKNPVIRSLCVLSFTRVIVKNGSSYSLNENLEEYQLPLSTIEIINEQEKRLNLNPSWIPNTLNDVDMAWKMMNRHIPAYLQVKEKTFKKIYLRKELESQKQLEFLRNLRPRSQKTTEIRPE